MKKKSKSETEKQLRLENEELRSRITEAEETLNAIRSGEVDAIVVSGPDGEKVFSLTSAETPYRIIVEEMNEGAVCLSADGTILYCNRCFAELVGVPLEQITGSSFMRFVEESDKSKFQALVKTGIKERCEGVIAYLSNVINPAYFHLSFSPLPSLMLGDVCIMTAEITKLIQKEEELKRSNDYLEQRITERTSELGKTIENLVASRLAVMNMLQDLTESKDMLENANRQLINEITERKQAEVQLKESEAQYRNLADTGLALVWTAGTDKLCTYFNKPWLDFTGRTLEQEMGNGWTEGVHPDDLDRCVEIYVTAFDKREAFDMEYRLHHVSGEYRWLRDLGSPNYNVSGEFIGYVGHCFDINSQKHAEEEIRNFNKNLEQKIKERTVELNETIDLLEETNRVFVGRELRMIELKEQIAELEKK